MSLWKKWKMRQVFMEEQETMKGRQGKSGECCGVKVYRIWRLVLAGAICMSVSCVSAAAETTSVEATSVEATPAETTSAETTLAETTPAETTSAEIAAAGPISMEPAIIEETLEENSPDSTSKDSQLQKKLYAQSAVLIDGDTGRVLFGKEEEAVRPMASTTKIMTCILALEQGNMEDVATVSSYAASQPKVHLGAPAGRTFYIKDLLYSLMLESHNDSAVVIAEHIGGSVKGFAEQMNKKARELGCEHTCFITPNGLDASVTAEDGTVQIHSTTAKDLAYIMGYCVWQSPKREEFLNITRTQNYFFTDSDGKGSYSCVNHNALLTMMDGVVSGKTGFTGGAGYSYVAAMEDGESHFAIALLGCGWPPHKTYKWSDARALFSYGKEHYEKREVYREPQLKNVRVRNGIPQNEDLGEQAYTGLTLNLKEEEKTLKLLMREEEQVTVQIQIPDELTAPVKKNTEVGKAVYVLDGKTVGSFPIYTEDSIDALSFSWCMKKIKSIFLFSQKSPKYT